MSRFSRSLIKVTKRIFRSFGIDMIRYNLHTSEDVLLKTILGNFNIATILDVGANEGQYASGVINLGYSGAIYSFEPISSVYQKLQKKSSTNPRWSAFQIGIGSSEDKVSIHVSENLVSSSILRLNEDAIRIQPRQRASRSEEINITTIDSFISRLPLIHKEILLKLDIQGYELEALKGAKNTLAATRLVQVELNFAQVYDGAPSYKDVWGFLEGLGFEIFTIIPGFRDPVNGRMLQADGIFVNKKL